LLRTEEELCPQAVRIGRIDARGVSAVTKRRFATEIRRKEEDLAENLFAHLNCVSYGMALYANIPEITISNVIIATVAQVQLWIQLQYLGTLYRQMKKRPDTTCGIRTL